jgi:CDP-diacylglycerol--glycerol-3-phosphate 3-phosphatidyltransferase
VNDLTDDDFVAAFLSGMLPPTHFHHRDHLRLAWCLIRQAGVEQATGTITGGIRRFATQHGQADKYHETLTQFWVRLVSHLIDVQPEITVFERFLDRFPQLLDKALPSQHWRRETLQSQAARAQWVEPDVLSLPARKL